MGHLWFSLLILWVTFAEAKKKVTRPPLEGEFKMKYLGCWREAGWSVIRGARKWEVRITNEWCAKLCYDQGFPFAGTRPRVCTCGVVYDTLGPTGACVKPCGGNRRQICGNDWASSVYATVDPIPEQIQYTKARPFVWKKLNTLEDTGNYTMTEIGCFKHDARYIMNGARMRTSNIEACGKFCFDKNLKYAGLNYGRFCVCGNEYDKWGRAGCTRRRCGSNKSRSCGGRQVNLIYELNANPVGPREIVPPSEQPLPEGSACSSSPCQNEGQCKDVGGQITCECAGGYEGETCETDIDECSSNPCLNGAECTDGENEFECECADGYKGETCETDIDECSSNPCLNGAQCNVDVNKFACECRPGYQGVTCETDINECSSNPCLNGGTCRNYINKFMCKCAGGYEGRTCDTETDFNMTSVGCWREAGWHVLRGAGKWDARMTNDMCGRICFDAGFPFAGTRTRRCTCGVVYDTLGPSGCTRKCDGDRSQICGNNWAMSVYATIYPIPEQIQYKKARPFVWKPLNTLKDTGNYTMTEIGCFKHDARYIMNGASMRTSNIEACGKFCVDKNLKYAGLNYGRNCVCGNEYDKWGRAGCRSKCKTNKSRVCGGRQVNLIYELNANPVGPREIVSPSEQPLPGSVQADNEDNFIALDALEKGYGVASQTGDIDDIGVEGEKDADDTTTFLKAFAKAFNTNVGVVIASFTVVAACLIFGTSALMFGAIKFRNKKRSYQSSLPNQ